MWRNDGRCGSGHRLPDGTPAQCDPDGKNPCCNRYDGECGNTTKQCSCQWCTDYKFAKWWRESGGTQMWRNDGRCGRGYRLPDGTPAQCDPEGKNPCCGINGECGITTEHCSCYNCTDYKFAKWWRESGSTQMWRNDGMCGSHFPLPDGTPGQCDPDGDKPCCSDSFSGHCGNTEVYCSCMDCTNYKFAKWWRESGGTQMWRNDGMCGSHFPLPDGKPGQCDPKGKFPCCHDFWGRCSGTRDDCTCQTCIDYRNMKWRYDGKCGSDNPLPDGSPAECNPGGEKPCCNGDRRCSGLSADCFCENCTDHRLTIRLTKDRMCDPNWKDASYGFKCNNGKCANLKQLCNRVDDCGDMSDEIYCTNHMICRSTVKTDNPNFVPASAICDGFSDCFDWSDECNDLCGREILGSWALKITCCFMGILAIVFNCVSMVHGVTSTIYDCPTEKMMITKVLIILIGSGDFLIGVYLIVLSIYDSLVYGKSYCEHQPEWLTGTPCMILGVISTVGSQVSLFSMTTLSCIIMYGVVLKEMRFPSEVTRKSVLKATSLALALITVSVIIAVTPLIPLLEDYFVQGMYYDSDVKELRGFLDKVHHYKLLDKLKHKRDFIVTPTGKSRAWSDIREEMSEFYGDLPSYPVHFYGNDGVCLFKYFVRRDNEYTQENMLEKNRIPNNELYDMGFKKIIMSRNVTVWAMLIVNFICFVIITVCYIAITCTTKKSTQESGQHDNPDRLRENKALQNRLILIIVTDFLCWVPFIIISGMHNLKYIDASKWYTPFAMTVLPINSVINPLLYDKIMSRFVMRKIRQAWEIISVRLRIISAWVESTRLYQGIGRQLGLAREYIAIKLRDVSARVALYALCQKRDEIENADLPENAIPMELINQ